MKKILLSLTPLSVLPVVMAVSCATKFEESKINGYITVDESETDKISKYLDAHHPDIIPISGYTLNDYYLSPNLIQNKNIEFKLDGNNYAISLSTSDLTKKVNQNERTTEANHILKTERTFTYKAYKLVDSEWKYIDDYNWTFKIPVTVDFVLPSNISTAFTDDLKVPIQIDWESVKGHWVEAKIAYWADGDTPKFIITQEPNLLKNNDSYMEYFKNKTTLSLRIQGIDTPEKNVGRNFVSKPFEHQYAELSTDFGVNNIPTGTPIRIFLNGRDTFGREVGDFFFGDNFQYSYAVSITNAGLTLPLVNESAFTFYKNPENVDHYTLIPIANAFNTAIAKRRGFFINFHTPFSVSSTIYLAKQNNQWDSLWLGNPRGIYKSLNIKFTEY